MERFKDGLDRRKFLKLAGKAAYGLTAAVVAAPFIEPVVHIAHAETTESLEATILQEYLALTEPTKRGFQKVVETQDLFANFKSLTQEQRVEDFEMYFPIYWGAQQTYQTPWPLLWIMHTHETTVSRDVNPDIGWQKGAMQRDVRFYGTATVQEAIKGWRPLRYLPQRYKKGILWETNDYEEIFFAAWKLKNDARNIQSYNPSLDFDEAILQAQYSYCAREFASQRIAKYREIAPLLTVE